MTIKVDEGTLSLGRILREIPVTLVIGWEGENGIFLAADDIAREDSGYAIPAKRQRQTKIKNVGKNCAVALINNAARASKILNLIRSKYPHDEKVNVSKVANQLAMESNNLRENERDFSLLVGGWEETANGNIPRVYHVEKQDRDKDYSDYPTYSKFAKAGYSQYVQLLEDFVSLWEVTDFESIKKIASFFFAMTDNSVIGGVGEIGSFAIINQDGCIIKSIEDNDSEIIELRKFGAELKSKLKEFLNNELLKQRSS